MMYMHLYISRMMDRFITGLVVVVHCSFSFSLYFLFWVCTAYVFGIAVDRQT